MKEKKYDDSKMVTYTFPVSDKLYHDIHRVAKLKGTTVNDELLEIMKECIDEFEKEHGEIKLD